MSLLKKIWTGVRGKAHETGDAIVDANALAILDQEIRDADSALAKARDQLSLIAAKRSLAEKECNELGAEKDKYLNAARASLEKGQDDLARRSAERVAQLEQQLDAKRQVMDDYSLSEKEMRASVAGIESKIKGLKQQVETVKANEAVIRAQAAVASSSSGMNSRLGDASASLQRIKERQELQRARIREAETLDNASSGADLDAALEAAGVTGTSRSADDILASLSDS